MMPVDGDEIVWSHTVSQLALLLPEPLITLRYTPANPIDPVRSAGHISSRSSEAIRSCSDWLYVGSSLGLYGGCSGKNQNEIKSLAMEDSVRLI